MERVKFDIWAFDKTKRAFESIKKNVKGIEGTIGGIKRSFGGLGAIITGVFAVSKIKNAIIEYETFEAQLKTLTGSAEGAGKAMGLIEDFATRTPFQINEIVDSFVKLKNLGLDPSEEALISYGNTAVSMGKDLNQMIEAVADATTGEFERLKEFGIKASSEGDNVTFTFQGVKTTIQKEAKEIEKYLRSIGDVQFAGAIQEQANTLKVAGSNMMDTFSRLFDAIGDAGLTAALKGMAKALTWVTDKLIYLVKIMGKGVDVSKAYFKTIGEGLKLITFNSSWDEFKQNMEGIKEDLFDMSSFETPEGKLSDFSTKFKTTADTVKSSAEETKKSVDDIGDSIRSSLVDSLFDSEGSIKNWGDSLKSIFLDVGKSYLDNVLKNFMNGSSATPGSGSGSSSSGFGLGGLISGLSESFGGFFAKGGTLQPGQWGIAGENGPEPIFAGGRPMTVTPNNGGSATNVTVNYNIKTPDVQNFRKSQSQLAAETANFIKRANRNF
jgi:hypothetical protein